MRQIEVREDELQIIMRALEFFYTNDDPYRNDDDSSKCFALLARLKNAEAQPPSVSQ